MAIANGIKLVGIIFTHSILMLQNVNNSELTLHGSVSSLFCMGTHYAHYTGGIVCMSSSTSTYRWFQLFFIKSGIVNFFSPETVILLTQSAQNPSSTDRKLQIHTPIDIATECMMQWCNIAFVWNLVVMKKLMKVVKSVDWEEGHFKQLYCHCSINIQ